MAHTFRCIRGMQNSMQVASLHVHVLLTQGYCLTSASSEPAPQDNQCFSLGKPLRRTPMHRFLGLICAESWFQKFEAKSVHPSHITCIKWYAFGRQILGPRFVFFLVSILFFFEEEKTISLLLKLQTHMYKPAQQASICFHEKAFVFKS